MLVYTIAKKIALRYPSYNVNLSLHVASYIALHPTQPYTVTILYTRQLGLKLLRIALHSAKN